MDELVQTMRTEQWKKKEIATKMKYYQDIFMKLNIELTIENMDLLYNASKSISSSFRSTTGKDFEHAIEQILDLSGVAYSKQVYIKDDIVVSRRKNATYTADIIFPDINIGENIKNFNLISIKTSLRERHLQDNGLNFKKKYLITLETRIPKNVSYDTIVVPSYIKTNIKAYSIEEFIETIKN